MRNRSFLLRLFLLIVPVIVISCGTKKQMVSGGSGISSTAGASDKEMARRQTVFLQKVIDNAAYSKNISAKMSFRILSGGTDFTISGQLRMRKDEVIRIQLTPMGLMEAFRLEFTKDHVLIVDRLNREYVKAGYQDVSFLKQNGLDFYTLQALFWNELFIPGEQRVVDSSLKTFEVQLKEGALCSEIGLPRDKMSYQWTAENATGLIRKVDISYSSNTHGTTHANCVYDAFKPLGSKKFPADITMNISTQATKKARNVSINLQLDRFETSADWTAETQLSGKYRQVDVQEVLNRLSQL